jgi:hypothetical protein
MSATPKHPATARRRARKPHGGAVVSLEHIMALAAELHRRPAPTASRSAAAVPREPVRISAEEWALLFPSWPAAQAGVAA